jgi:hypothetical protein
MEYISPLYLAELMVFGGVSKGGAVYVYVEDRGYFFIRKRNTTEGGIYMCIINLFIVYCIYMRQKKEKKEFFLNIYF